MPAGTCNCNKIKPNRNETIETARVQGISLILFFVLITLVLILESVYIRFTINHSSCLNEITSEEIALKIFFAIA